VVGLYVSGQPVKRLTYDAFGRTNKGGRFSQDETLFDAVSAGYLGMDFDFQTLLYLDGGRYYDAAGGRYLTPGSMALGTIGIYAFANNTPVDRSNSIVATSSFNSSVASASSVYAAAFFEEASVSNQWNQGNYGKAILYGTGQLMAAVGTAGLGAIAGGIALGGTTVAYAIGTGGAVAGASSGMISTALSSNGQADFSEYMLAGGVGGFFGGLNGVGSMVGLGTGLAGAGIGSLSGNASAGFQIGDMVGGIASGGIDDYARALGKGASRMGALRHAAARVGVEGGFTVGGGVAGYAATGTMDGALAGASFGQMLGGAIGNLTVACFAAGTPLVVDFEGNSRSIEDIEVGDYVLARSEFDAAGPLELKRVEEKFVRVAPVMELVVRGQVITTTAEHPFYVAGEERFVPAGELTLEDQLVDSQGRPIAIDAIRVTDRLITVYNLRVADFHTYFVGGKLWQFDAWVHNAGEPYVTGAYDRVQRATGKNNHHLLQRKAFPDDANVKSGPVVRVDGRTSDLGSEHNLAHRSLEGFWEPHRLARTTPTVGEYLEALDKSLRTAGLSAQEAYQLTGSARRFAMNRLGLVLDDLVPCVPGRFPSQFLPGGSIQ
jgi:RHS repeat-associated protein